MLEVNLSPQELLEWLNNPTTQEIFRVLRETRAIWVRNLETGDTLRETADLTVQETARAVGVIYGIDLLLEMK